MNNPLFGSRAFAADAVARAERQEDAVPACFDRPENPELQGHPPTVLAASSARPAPVQARH